MIVTKIEAPDTENMYVTFSNESIEIQQKDIAGTNIVNMRREGALQLANAILRHWGIDKSVIVGGNRYTVLSGDVCIGDLFYVINPNSGYEAVLKCFGYFDSKIIANNPNEKHYPKEWCKKVTLHPAADPR